MNAVAREFRVTIRSLCRTLGFTSAAVLTLALGMGASVAIVTVINSALLDPLPFKDPDQLVVVMETDLRTSRMLGVSTGTLLDWKDTVPAHAQAAALAGTGVFALVGYIVGQRTREIGIRLALGARPGEVFRTILGDAAVMGGLGSTAGVIATLGMNRVLANRLFGVAPTDPLTLITATALLFIVCIGACAVLRDER
jgi:hypothetical protein